MIGQSEIGQGITTGLCQVIADELGADWNAVGFQFATSEPEHVHPLIVMAGGSFGRRGMPDYARQAAFAAAKVKRPVKLIWSREEDIAHDYFRPPMLARMQARLSQDGDIKAWQQRNTGPGMWKFTRPELVFGWIGLPGG